MQSMHAKTNDPVDIHPCTSMCAIESAALDENKRLRQENLFLNHRLREFEARFASVENNTAFPQFNPNRRRSKGITALQEALLKRRLKKESLQRQYMSNSSRPSYISCESLESMILFTASTKIANIERVIVEPALCDQKNGANWRVSGIVCGRTDFEAANQAVRYAAERHAAWRLVEDHSPLLGRFVDNLVCIDDHKST